MSWKGMMWFFAPARLQPPPTLLSHSMHDRSSSMSVQWQQNPRHSSHWSALNPRRSWLIYSNQNTIKHFMKAIQQNKLDTHFLLYFNVLGFRHKRLSKMGFKLSFHNHCKWSLSSCRLCCWAITSNCVQLLTISMYENWEWHALCLNATWVELDTQCWTHSTEWYQINTVNFVYLFSSTYLSDFFPCSMKTSVDSHRRHTIRVNWKLK